MTSAGRREYVRTHWGERGTVAKRELRAPDPSSGTLVELGELISVTYRTTKGGDDAATDYEHHFEPRRPTSSAKRPVLAYLAGDGGLVICGGNYRVTKRGIEG